MQSKQDIIRTLALEPHPEGGYYRRTYKNQDGPLTEGGTSRGYATAIYYLAEGDRFSRWHRTDGDELWFWHAGAPLTLEIKGDDDTVTQKQLGDNYSVGELPQQLAPKNQWQRAKSAGEWTLVSCSVSPGFLFETFEMLED
ncbi:cupin domain-containing protein [Kordiimonas aquimaris]|uniref:cupin domain-containing protein n=1 Tax=Kordiimonas aquimaris TaxID=707591 RepID=UPI0021D2FF57|nr:cupin domain-containing protein [Kordiimonas aquimaris]